MEVDDEEKEWSRIAERLHVPFDGVDLTGVDRNDWFKDFGVAGRKNRHKRARFISFLKKQNEKKRTDSFGAADLQHLTGTSEETMRDEPLQQPWDGIVQLQTQQVHLLKLLSEEVNKTRKSRLNCWEKESDRTTGSQRNPGFRKKVIKYYQRENSSGKSVKCQILDEHVTHAVAQHTIIASHIWKASTRGKGLEEFGLCATDINSARNAMFLTKGIEDAFDNQQVCFLYNSFNQQLCLWVADAQILLEKIEGSKPPKTFADVHQKPLHCPDENHMPFRRLLSWHARLTLELRKQSIELPNYKSVYDLSPGRESAQVDPISQAINDMVEPGEDASVSGR